MEVAETWGRVSRVLGPVTPFLFQETAEGRSSQGLAPFPREAEWGSGKLLA